MYMDNEIIPNGIALYLENMIKNMGTTIGISVDTPNNVVDTIYNDILKIGAIRELIKEPSIRIKTLLGDREVKFDVSDLLSNNDERIRVYGTSNKNDIESISENGIPLSEEVLDYFIEKSLDNKETIIDTLRNVNTGIVVFNGQIYVGMNKEAVELIDKNMPDTFLYELCCECNVSKEIEPINFYSLVNIVNVVKEFIQGYKEYLAKAKLLNINESSKVYFKKLRDKHYNEIEVIKGKESTNKSGDCNVTALLRVIYDELEEPSKYSYGLFCRLVTNYGMNRTEAIEYLTLKNKLKGKDDAHNIEAACIDRLNNILSSYSKSGKELRSKRVDNIFETLSPGYLHELAKILNINFTQLVYRLIIVDNMTIERAVELGIQDFNEYGLNIMEKGRKYTQEPISYDMTVAYFMNTMVKKYLS